MLKIEYEGATFSFSDEQASQLWGQIITLLDLNHATKNKQPQKHSQTSKNPTDKQPYNKGKRKIFPLGSRLWTQEDFDILVSKEAELEAQGVKRSEREKLIGQALGRTRSSVGVKLFLHRHGQPLIPKLKWGKKSSRELIAENLPASSPAGSANLKSQEQKSEVPKT